MQKQCKISDESLETARFGYPEGLELPALLWREPQALEILQWVADVRNLLIIILVAPHTALKQKTFWVISRYLEMKSKIYIHFVSLA